MRVAVILFEIKSTGINVIGFSLVWFYGITNIGGYLMPDPIYTYIYILNIYDLSTHFVDNIFKQAGNHLLHTFKWLQALLFHIIQHYSFICTQLNDPSIVLYHKQFN